MRTPERQLRRNAKIARAMIRLKHSLVADDEIYDFLEQQKQALIEGGVPVLQLEFSDSDDQ